MQTFLSLIELLTTAFWLLLFILAAWLYVRTHANPRVGVVPSAGRSSPAVVNTQTYRRNSAPRKLVRQKSNRTRHNVLSTRGGPEPLKFEDFHNGNDHRQGTYEQFDNGISTRECPGQRSGYDRNILIVNCENATRGRTVQRRRA